jgi:hypothetical protein
MRALFLALGLALSFCACAFPDAAGDCTQAGDRDLSIRGCTLIVEGRAWGDKAAEVMPRPPLHSWKCKYPGWLLCTARITPHPVLLGKLALASLQLIASAFASECGWGRRDAFSTAASGLPLPRGGGWDEG